MSIEIRPAAGADQDAIVALVHSERLKPFGIRWPNFVVAAHSGRLVGAAQMRRHSDGSRELGSLVVAPRWRGRGVARQMIEALVAGERRPVFTITRQVRAAAFARWDFRRIPAVQAPAAILRNYCAGQIGGGFVSLLHGRAPSRLVILARPCGHPDDQAYAPGPLRDLASRVRLLPMARQ
jgi:amino-acid N-acetyltransferase